MNFYPFHPGDYMLRTAHLDLIEDLAYRRLLDLYYINEQPLQGEPDAIARVIRMRSNVTEVAAVLGEFFTQTEAGWQHSHCDQVIGQYQAKAKQAAENGKRGGRPRKADATPEQSQNNPEETQPVISANPEESGSKTNQEPITNNQNQVDQEHVAAEAPTAALDEKATGADQPKRAKRLAADWTLPAEYLAWALSDRPEFNEALVAREAEKFADHWHAASGKSAAKLDWFATWRNWVRNARLPNNVRPIQQSRFTNLPPVNADEIRAKTEENKRLGVRRANF